MFVPLSQTLWIACPGSCGLGLASTQNLPAQAVLEPGTLDTWQGNIAGRHRKHLHRLPPLQRCACPHHCSSGGAWHLIHHVHDEKRH